VGTLGLAPRASRIVRPTGAIHLSARLRSGAGPAAPTNASQDPGRTAHTTEMQCKVVYFRAAHSSASRGRADCTTPAPRGTESVPNSIWPHERSPSLGHALVKCLSHRPATVALAFARCPLSSAEDCWAGTKPQSGKHSGAQDFGRKTLERENPWSEGATIARIRVYDTVW
jgi:hypothetical protein